MKTNCECAQSLELCWYMEIRCISYVRYELPTNNQPNAFLCTAKKKKKRLFPVNISSAKFHVDFLTFTKGTLCRKLHFCGSQA